MSDRLHVFSCPVDGCGWAHVEPEFDPRIEADQLAGVFGPPGVMAQVATNQRAARIEKSIGQHLATHSSLEWLKTLHAMSRQRDALVEAVNGLLDNFSGKEWAVQMQVAGDLLRDLGERK